MKRLKPDPMPMVRPVWEYTATGDLHKTYEAYKHTLNIPWVGVVTMAYAAYPTFFNTWWEGIRPAAQSALYAERALNLRHDVEDHINKLNPSPMTGTLLKKGYSSREINEIRAIIETITHGNFMQIIAVLTAPILLQGGELSSQVEVGPDAVLSSIKSDSPPFVLIEPHHALSDVRTLYDDIMATLGLPFVNTDYRCFSRWPSYFIDAWADLKPLIDTPAYEDYVLGVHNTFVNAVHALPNPSGLKAEHLIDAANQDASVEEVLNVTRVFAWLLPGLVTNVAFFRAQLMDA